MKEKILELEKSLFKIEYISNKKYLENIIHENFLECGKSGLLYDNEITIDSLLECKEDRNIKIYNFACEQIDNNTYLIHYITRNDNKKYFRTSIWKEEDTLRLYFHQATLLVDEIKLIES
jgi:hypothetical protein